MQADLGELSRRISGRVIAPDDPDYDTARRVWNGLIDRRPLAIVQCTSTDDVAAAIRFARQSGVPLTVRGGGHNVAGSSVRDDALLVDLSRMRAVEVDAAAARGSVGGGALWADVDAATAPHGLATTGGLISHTGVGGLTLGGGIGWLMRRDGLTCDNLVAAEVVTAEGTVVRAAGDADADLLWALRGGGGNFGVVTRFEFALHPASVITAAIVMFRMDAAAEVLRCYREFTADCPDDLTTMAAFLTAPPAPFVPADLVGQPVVAVLGCHAGDPAAAERDLAPIDGFGPPAARMVGPLPYQVLQGLLDEGAPHGMLAYWRTEYLAGLGDDVIDVLVEHARRDPSPFGAVHVHHLEGAVARVAEGATAFSRRYAPYVVNVPAGWMDPADTDANVAWVREFSDALRPVATGDAYPNFVGIDEQDRVRAAYGPNYERLVELKRRYDPDDVFRANLALGRPATA